MGALLVKRRIGPRAVETDRATPVTLFNAESGEGKRVARGERLGTQQTAEIGLQVWSSLPAYKFSMKGGAQG